MTMTSARSQHIKDYFDVDAGQYLTERYPKEPRTCDQFSYVTRRQYVLEMLDAVKTRGRLLDVGCGPGVLVPDLVRRGWRVNGVDLSSGMLAAARRAVGTLAPLSVTFAAADATRLPFRPATFDAVLCIGVVSYVEDLSALLNGINAVLRPGGEAIFQVSNAWSVSEMDVWLRGRLRKLIPRKELRDPIDRFGAVVRLKPYRPADFDGHCARAGFVRREFRFYNFRPPLAVDRLAPTLSLRAGRRLEALRHSRWAVTLGAGYLVRVQRTGDPQS
jgi:SAM-dependent methyltransferase